MWANLGSMSSSQRDTVVVKESFRKGEARATSLVHLIVKGLE